MYSANMTFKNLNGIIKLVGDSISIPQNEESMIFGVTEGRFAYITPEELKRLNPTSETKTLSIPMHIVSEANNNYNFIRGIVMR
jgi:hypothetical protein